MFNIIVCAYNKLELSKKCIESIRSYTESGKYRILFVNDGSTDDTEKWCKYHNRDSSDFFYTTNKENQGYVRSAVRAVELAMQIWDDGHIFLLNNDVALLSCWAHGADKLLKKYDIIGAAGQKEVAGQNINFISGSRLIVKRKVIQKIGFYDKNFDMGYWEDVDFSWRAQKSGFKISKYKYFEESSVHLRGSTFKHNPNRAKLFKKNKSYFEKKILGEI